ncbi:FMN-dependent NADH-azoreductase [Streptomyces flavalbus]|uniref:FMN dependent NADH:quinone oxidoreductase n=1 Tax=Streptomyces flavalbus TaxID=2665155 RepID=A0ABW2WHX4_9ACTN
MTTLLHIDSSVFQGEASASRAVAETFRRTWQEQHPDGTVIYRDLAKEPVPHLTAEAHTAGFVDPATHTPEQAAAFGRRLELIRELEEADAVLIGAPMYNYTIPSTLKAWLDNVVLFGRTAGEAPSAKGTPVTVVASRGGSYGPGTPKEGNDYVRNYLHVILADAMAMEVEFIVPELTMAPHNPAMSELVPLYESSRERAHQHAVSRARQLAHQG